MSDTTANPGNDDGNPLADPDIDKQTVTNDAVGGEPVDPTGHYAGPTGSEPLEAEPVMPENELAGEDIDLEDEQ